MRVGIAMESMRPRLAFHAYTGPLAARIAEVFVQLQGTCLRIEVHDEQTVIPIFARVQHDAATVSIGGDPVRLLFVVECDPRYLADVGWVGDVVSRECVCRRQRLYPVVSDPQRHTALIALECLQMSRRGVIRVDFVQLVQPTRKRVD